MDCGWHSPDWGSEIAAALILTRMQSGFSQLLYGVNANDPATFFGVSVVLVVVATLACYIPARRAAKVDPDGGTALRVKSISATHRYLHHSQIRRLSSVACRFAEPSGSVNSRRSGNFDLRNLRLLARYELARVVLLVFWFAWCAFCEV